MMARGRSELPMYECANDPMGAPVDWDRQQPVDFVSCATLDRAAEVREGIAASHVGIFVRDGQVVNALNEERGVIASDPISDSFKPRYLRAWRLV